MGALGYGRFFYVQKGGRTVSMELFIKHIYIHRFMDCSSYRMASESEFLHVKIIYTRDNYYFIGIFA